MMRAVIYCRCSTEEESQQNALIQQVQESRRSVEEQGWLLVDEYIEARSGTTTAGRDEYNRLMADLQEDKFDVIQIKTQDRLMRNTRDWYLFIDQMVTNGKRLYMYLERKFYTPDDALITGIRAILAEEYSKELSGKINNAHHHRQRAGRRFILPADTYGLMRTEDGRIVPVEKEMEAIREIFCLARTMGCGRIRRYLSEHGITDRNGLEFSETAIRRIIRNPIRCGTVVQNRRHFDFQQKKLINVPEDQWIIHRNAVPAAVSEEEWKEANDCMDRRVSARNARSAGRAVRDVRSADRTGQDARSAGRTGQDARSAGRTVRDVRSADRTGQDVWSAGPSGRDVRNIGPAGRNPGKYYLSGKLRCGLCGSTYYRTTRTRYRDGEEIAEWKCSRYLREGRGSACSCTASTSDCNGTALTSGCDGTTTANDCSGMALVCDGSGMISTSDCSGPASASGCDGTTTASDCSGTALTCDGSGIASVCDCRDTAPVCGGERPAPSRGCMNIHLDEERLLRVLEQVCLSNDGDSATEYSELADRATAILREVLQQVRQDVPAVQGGRFKKEIGRLEQQSETLLEKLLDGIITDEDYKRKKCEISEKIKTLQGRMEELRDAERVQTTVEQRLELIRRRLDENTMRRAAAAHVIEHIDRITVYPGKLLLSFRAGEPADSSGGIPGSAEGEPEGDLSEAAQQNRVLEVPLGEDFLYATRKAAEYRRIIGYMHANPRISAKEIAELEGVSLSAVNSRISRLKKRGILHFQGAGGHGEWVIDREMDRTMEAK